MDKSQSRILKVSPVSVSQLKMWESLGLAKKNASLTVSQSLNFTIGHPLYDSHALPWWARVNPAITV